MKRLFVAVDISEPVREKVVLAIAQMQVAARGVKVAWTTAGNLHVTLKFLGTVEDERLAVVSASLREVAAQVQAFDFDAADVGVFPDERAPRSLWVGISETGALSALATALDRQFSELGFKAESRVYSPHLTVGRVKAGRETASLLEPYRAKNFGHTRVSSIVLFESILSSVGSSYRPIFQIPLIG